MITLMFTKLILFIASKYFCTTVFASDVSNISLGRVHYCLAKQTSDALISDHNQCFHPTNCLQRCGLIADGDSCSCDHLCWLYGDCCPDYHSVCLNLQSSIDTDAVLAAILPAYKSRYELRRFWDRVNWISVSECQDTIHGALFLVTKCSQRVEIMNRFHDLYKLINAPKTRSLFLKYLSRKSKEDIIRICEEATTKNGSEMHLLEKMHYFDKSALVGFYNVFCALCNGVLPSVQYLYLKCNIETYESSMSLSFLNNITNQHECSILAEITNFRSCDKRAHETMKGSNKTQFSYWNCFKFRYIFENITLRIRFQNPNCLHCFLEKVPTEDKYNNGSLWECNNLKCNCSDIAVPLVTYPSSIAILNVNDLVNNSIESCQVHQIFQPWSSQCEDLVCQQDYVPFYGNCVQEYRCSASNVTNEECVDLRPINRGQFVPVSQMFKTAEIPKLHLTISYDMRELLHNVLNATENDTCENTDLLHCNLKLQELLSLSITNTTLVENDNYFENAIYKMFRNFPDILRESDVDQSSIGKLIESLHCTKSTSKCVYHQASPFLQHSFFKDKDGDHNVDAWSKCDSVFPEQGRKRHEPFASPNACFSFVIRSESFASIDPIIKMSLTEYQMINTRSLHISEVAFRSRLKIFNRNLIRSNGYARAQGGHSYEAKSANVNYNISCAEGRRLTFSSVEVNNKLFELNNDIKIYVDTEELPLDGPWFEMSLSYDTHDFVFDNFIISLCARPVHDNHNFCDHGFYLRFPYSSVYFYKKLLIVSADTKKVSEFFQIVQYRHVHPLAMIGRLEKYMSPTGVKVYHKTSYILTNKGAMVCADPSNIYQDDRDMIAGLYMRQSKSGSSLKSTRIGGLTLLLLYLVATNSLYHKEACKVV